MCVALGGWYGTATGGWYGTATGGWYGTAIGGWPAVPSAHGGRAVGTAGTAAVVVGMPVADGMLRVGWPLG